MDEVTKNHTESSDEPDLFDRCLFEDFDKDFDLQFLTEVSSPMSSSAYSFETQPSIEQSNSPFSSSNFSPLSSDEEFNFSDFALNQNENDPDMNPWSSFSLVSLKKQAKTNFVFYIFSIPR
jgi:hypothetical protein